MPRHLTKAFLEQMQCSCGAAECDNRKIYFRASCHPKARVHASYNKLTGCLDVECGECYKPVAIVKVAEDTAEAPAG